jgi:hypothetical protein
MSHFLSNDSIAFDVEKITVVHWNCCAEYKTTGVEIVFNDGNEIYLHFDNDDDYQLINDLRDHFGYEPFPKCQ